MNVARTPQDLERVPRAVAIGTFDGVHRGHRRVVESALAAAGGNVSKAARALGLKNRFALYRLLKDKGIALAKGEDEE